MPSPTAQALAALLRRHCVLDMPRLRRTFPARSRASFMRDLAAIGALSSCNNSGGFYTLPDIPEFDADGLWRYERALFSRHGTLKATVRHLVRTADSGQTQRECASRSGCTTRYANWSQPGSLPVSSSTSCTST